jgi:ABC-2 type transport system ATP-binding protein
MSNPLLEIQNLSVRRGDLQVLEDLSFTVNEGEIFGLLGPNGSGKSTTFSILAGLLHPQKGTLFFRGDEIEGGAKRLLSEVGVVFQNPSLDPNLSARENLDMTATLYRVPKKERASRIDDLLRLADLIDRADERVATYSGGMKRRLELARSLMHNPKILIMDEPTTGLDEVAFQRTWKRLKELQSQRGLSILLSTHRPEEAAFCDRIGFILGGKLITCDTPQALQSQVSGDQINIHCTDSTQIIDRLHTQLGLTASLVDNQVHIRCKDDQQGHTLIPKIMDIMKQGEVHAIHMSRPNLGDVFLHLTGELLSEDYS